MRINGYEVVLDRENAVLVAIKAALVITGLATPYGIGKFIQYLGYDVSTGEFGIHISIYFAGLVGVMLLMVAAFGFLIVFALIVIIVDEAFEIQQVDDE